MMGTFVSLLEAVATALARFSDPAPASARKWDGTAYVPAGVSAFDPYAAKWWGIFTTLAGLLAGQEALSERQKAYLDRLLFGGMGSFNDFVLDEARLGSTAAQTNQELGTLRKKLFEEFRRM